MHARYTFGSDTEVGSEGHTVGIFLSFKLDFTLMTLQRRQELTNVLFKTGRVADSFNNKKVCTHGV